MALFKCKCGAEKIIPFCKVRPVCECGKQMTLADKKVQAQAGRRMTKADIEVFNWSHSGKVS